MAKLSDMGQQLLQWLQLYIPGFAEEFQPGISRAEVQSALGSLKFELPDDFYDLYEWRNGHPDDSRQSVGPVYHFNPIDLVAEEKNWAWWGSNSPKYKGYSTLPFITDNSEFFAVALGRSYQDDAYVIYVDRVGGTYLRYDSVTSMMASTIECFMSNAYYLNDEGWIEENHLLSAEILRSKNPRTLAEAMVDLRDAINIYGLDDESDSDRYSSMIAPLLSAMKTLHPLRLPESINMIQDHLARLQARTSDRATSSKMALHRWLNELDAT